MCRVLVVSWYCKGRVNELTVGRGFELADPGGWLVCSVFLWLVDKHFVIFLLGRHAGW